MILKGYKLRNKAQKPCKDRSDVGTAAINVTEGMVPDPQIGRKKCLVD